MKLKKFRYWLAGAILGGMIIEETDMEVRRQMWIKQQLDFGNTVTLEYGVTEKPAVH